jgi:hypothetical protein
MARESMPPEMFRALRPFCKRIRVAAYARCAERHVTRIS